MVFRFPPLCALCASVRDSSYFRNSPTDVGRVTPPGEIPGQTLSLAKDAKLAKVRKVGRPGSGRRAQTPEFSHGGTEAQCREQRSNMVFRFPPLCALCASVRDSSYFRKFSHKCRPGNPTRRNPGPRIISRQVRRARQVVPVESPPGPPDAKDNGLIAFLADENKAKTARG